MQAKSRPEKAPHLLTATPHKIALIRALGVRHLLIIAFDRQFAATEPEDFGGAIDSLLTDPARAADLGARAHDRAGDEFLAPRYITRTLELIEQMIA